MRIVSLLPSATETLYALGMGDAIVGVSHDSDYPPEVREQPIVSTSTISDGLSSAEIARQVGDTYHRGGSIYHIDPAFLERERPDLIIAQELCHVCAVTSEEARRAAELARSGARVLSFQPTSLAEVLRDIGVLGAAVGRGREAKQLADGLQRRVDDVRMRAAAVARRPRVLALGWLDPLMMEGQWVPEMIALAGGGLAVPGAHSRQLAWEAVVAYAPQVLLLMPCSFSLARTLAETQILQELPGWRALPAARTGRVYALDSAYFSRPGPRLVDGLEVLARCLHPERFPGPIPPHAAARLAPNARPIAEAFSVLA